MRGKRRIVIAGGGFSGVECARRLEAEFGDDHNTEIIMVSEDNFLLFTPMLPQVVSGMLETRHIVTPIRAVCEKIKFYEGRVRGIDPYGKTVGLWGTRDRRGVSIHYDFLVVALGSESNFFGMTDVESNAYTMKTLGDAVALRNRVIDMLEQSENETDPIRRRSLLNFVVVGGGFAGVETAGELMDLLLDARKHYHTIQREDIRVVVLEAQSSILPGFDQKLAEFAVRKMEDRGVEFRLLTAVQSFDGNEVKIKSVAAVGSSSGSSSGNNKKTDVIMSRTLIWTAGVTPVNTIKRAMLKTEKGKVVVNEYMQVPEFPGVFAVGDCAFSVDPDTKIPVPPTAQVAEAQAKVAANNLISLIRNRKMQKFVYKQRGQMAIIGKRTGIASIFGMNISGFWAWFVWRGIYLFKIPSAEKRLRVLLDWSIDLFYDRDISRLRLAKQDTDREHRDLDEVDDLW